MQSRRLIFFFKIWAVAFATTLYFAQASIAQSPEQRLIGLLEPKTPLPIADEKDQLQEEVAKEEEQHLPSQNFVVYGRARTDIDAGIAPQVDYRPILYAREPELIPDLEFPEPEENRKKRNLRRMPDLESFFTFGGTLELLTPTDAPLEKLDIVISELMWGVDTGVKDTTGTDTTVQTIFPDFETEESQWIELYNTTDTAIEAYLYLLFTPFKSYPNRDVVHVDVGHVNETNFKVP